MRELISTSKKKKKAQAGNEMSNIFQKSSQARKKPPPRFVTPYTLCDMSRVIFCICVHVIFARITLAARACQIKPPVVGITEVLLTRLVDVFVRSWSSPAMIDSDWWLTSLSLRLPTNNSSTSGNVHRKFTVGKVNYTCTAGNLHCKCTSHKV